MRVGKQTVSAVIFAAFVLSAHPAWASNRLLNTLHAAIQSSLDFLHSNKSSMGETLWKPLPSLATVNPACMESLLTRDGRRECILGNVGRLAKTTVPMPIIATANAQHGPVSSWSVAELDNVADFSSDTKIAYSINPPREMDDDDDMKVRPLWRDEYYDRARMPTAGVSFQSSF